MDNINILVVEDEPAQIQIFEDVITQFNKNSEIKFTCHVYMDYNAGVEALKTPYFDAAIIDLKLSNTNSLEGIKLVNAVHGKIRIPIIIYSGSISQIDDIPESILLKKRLRTVRLDSILKEVVLIYKTGITRLLRPAGDLDKKLTQIFWNQLADNLDVWIEHNNPKTLLRYIFTHFQEHMEIDTEGNFEEYHPAEIYLSPPIKTNIHTGDLIETPEGYFFVLTPACDIVYKYKKNDKGELIPFRKADNLVVARAKEFNVNKLCLNNNNKIDKNKIDNFVSNNSYRYHYLPSFKGNDGFIIDFQELKSLSFNDKMQRVATISGAFTKDIISRFSLYYARQGQPTFNQQEIINHLFNKFSN